MQGRCSGHLQDRVEEGGLCLHKLGNYCMWMRAWAMDRIPKGPMVMKEMLQGEHSLHCITPRLTSFGCRAKLLMPRSPISLTLGSGSSMNFSIVCKHSCPTVSITDLCQRSCGSRRNVAKPGVQVMCTVHPTQRSLRAHTQVRDTHRWQELVGQY